MDKQFKTKENDKISNILRKARFDPKFEESIDDNKSTHKKGRSEEQNMGLLTGILALFSNPLLH